MKLHTAGGSINTDTVSGNLDAHTTSGGIKVTIDRQLTEDAKLTTSGSSITANHIPDIQVENNASTSGGSELTLKSSGPSVNIIEI